jgi:hypothetical protein
LENGMFLMLKFLQICLIGRNHLIRIFQIGRFV